MGSLPGEGRPTPVFALSRRAADQPLQAARVRERGTLLRLSGSRQTVREDQRGAVTRQLQCEPQRDAGPDRVRRTRWARRGSRGARSGPELDGIGRSVHDPAERRALTAVPGPRKADLFYRLWSLREALIKALGTGCSLNPSRFEIPPAMLRGARSGESRFPHQPSDAWRLLDLSEARFAAAMAHRLAAPRARS